MNEDVPSVEIRADAETSSLGRNAYIAAANGDFGRHGKRASLVGTLAIVSVIACAMFFSRKPPQKSENEKGLATPSFEHQDPSINPKLMTEKDLTNLIPRPKVMASLFGKIRVVSLRSIGQLPIGSEMKAILTSGATDGIVKAVLTSPLLVDGEPVLPERTVFFGKGKSGDARLFVEFTKVIFPTGESFPIRAQALDLSDQILGLKGAIVGAKTKKMAGAVAFGLVGGMAAGLQDTSGSFFNSRRPTLRDGALAGASKASLDQSQIYLDEMKKSPNVIEVKSGTNIIIMTDEPKAKSNYEEE